MLGGVTTEKKFAIFGLSFSLPLAVLLYLFVSNINSDIAFAQAEKYGNAYQRSLEKLLYDVVQHKYLSEYARNDPSLKAQLASVAMRVDQDFAALTDVDQTLSGVLQTNPASLAKRKHEHYQVVTLAKEWQQLETQRGDTEQQYRHLIKDIRALISYVGDTSNLILDPDLDSYYLMDVTLLSLPQMQDRLQEVLSYGNAILRRNTISNAEKIQLNVYAALFKQSDLDRVRASIQKALSEDSNFYGTRQSLQEKLPPLLEEYTAVVETFIQLLQQMATPKVNGINVEQFRQAGELAFASSFVFWEAANQELDSLLDSRLDSYRQYRLISLLSALFTVFISIAIFVFRGLYQHSSQLEKRVNERTAELEASNKELQTFSYSLAHDLRTPLRSIDGFSQALLEDYGDKLDATGKEYIQRTRAASQRMGQLIDDLLNLAYLARSEIHQQEVNLSAMAEKIIAGIQKANPERQVKWVIAQGLTVYGDTHLLRVMLEQLLDNAWKFTSKQEYATIEFGKTHLNGKPVYFVRDDGVGFDMAYVNKLFGTFQRLHTPAEFAGTGIGLAIAQRIIRRHEGDIWAEGMPGKGAIFYFTL